MQIKLDDVEIWKMDQDNYSRLETTTIVVNNIQYMLGSVLRKT